MTCSCTANHNCIGRRMKHETLTHVSAFVYNRIGTAHI